MQRLLVTGASGFIGWNICQRMRGERDIVGVTHTHNIAIPGIETRSVDLCDAGAAQALLDDASPDIVIHAAAEANANVCQEHARRTRPINVDAVISLGALCGQRDIPLVFTSTDLVFDGLYAPYAEDATVRPLSEYGRQKVAAETGISENCPKALVCRLPLLFGHPSPTSSDFTQRMLALIREDRPVRLFTDEYRTPVSVDAMIDGLFLAIEQETRGILHLGGEERVSRYEFGTMLIEASGITGARLVPCCQSDLPMAAPRPSDVSLNSQKAFDMGYQPGPLENQIHAFLGLL